MKVLQFCLAIILLYYTAANAQIPSSKFKDTYKERAQKETNTMISRYKLNAAQAAKIKQLNAAIYAQVNTVLLNNKERHSRKRAVDQVRAKREEKLKQIFTKPQYAAYRKDMDAIELKAMQRADSLNRNRPRQRLRLNN
jgi:hypothetical protein